ncbi:MAG TPA: Ig-like domain-containing protein [Candidatus Eisenbacteria bacterium]|nr:Ig-like domain-containing protein [Candidatus Eisenbacteria bacterium]
MLRKTWIASFALLLAACSGVKNTGGGGGTQPGSATLNGLSITPTSATVLITKTQSLQATGSFSDGTTKDLTSSVTWSSSDSTTAAVSAAGVVTGAATGLATVTARSGTFSASTQITVTSANVCATPVSIAVTPANPTVPVNTTQQLVATGTNSDASTCDVTDLVTWSSSTIANATVSAGGLVKGVTAGSSTVTATLGSVAGSTSVTVTAPSITSISVTPDDMTLAIGVGQQYIASAIYSDGSIQDLVTGVTWTSSNTSVATIDGNGLATTLAAGSTNITATVGTFTDSSVITVVAAHLQSITLTPTNVTMAAGTQQQFTASGNFDDGSTQVLTSALWSSSALSVLTVDANGLGIAVGPGTSTVSVTSGTVSASTSVTVSTATLVSLAVAPVNSSMPDDATKQFSATGTFSDNSTQDVTQSVLWSSSTPAVATITNLGLVTSVSTGSTTITAMLGSVNNSTALTVSNVKLVSITISPANARVQKGTSLKFTATGNYSDGSTAVLANVSWRSSKNNLANMRGSGILHAKKAGTLTVTASASGVTGSTSVTIGTGTLVSIDIAPANPTVAAGGTQQFIALGTFSDSSTQDVSINSHWSSTISSVATIANAPVNAGLATTTTTGTTTIGVNHGGITATTTLTAN